MKGTGFFGDGEGNLSSMRLMCFIALVNAVAIAWVFGLRGMLAAEVALMIAPWLTVAVGGKVGQAFAERPGKGKEVQ